MILIKAPTNYLLSFEGMCFYNVALGVHAYLNYHRKHMSQRLIFTIWIKWCHAFRKKDSRNKIYHPSNFVIQYVCQLLWNNANWQVRIRSKIYDYFPNA